MQRGLLSDIRLMIRPKPSSCAVCVAVALLASQVSRLCVCHLFGRCLPFLVLLSIHIFKVSIAHGSRIVQMRTRYTSVTVCVLTCYQSCSSTIRRLSGVSMSWRTCCEPTVRCLNSRWRSGRYKPWLGKHGVEWRYVVDSLVLLLSLSSDVFCAVLLKHSPPRLKQ